jgi:hypothetical protein
MVVVYTDSEFLSLIFPRITIEGKVLNLSNFKISIRFSEFIEIHHLVFLAT